MKTVYLFDIDIIERSTRPTFPKLPNHALCKLTDYYKKKGYNVKLIYKPQDIPYYYEDNIYIGSALYIPNLNRFKKRLHLLKKKYNHPNQLQINNIHIGTPTDYCPITDMEGVVCDYSLYDKMIEKDNIKLSWYPRNIGFLTRHCIRRCGFCVNRDRTKIREVNKIEDIYQIPNTKIELLDDNLFAYHDAPRLLREIGDFYRKHHVQIRLQNGLDCRDVTNEKIHALKYASAAFNELYAAWDDVKNTYIFHNINKIKLQVTSPEFFTYILIGNNVTDEESFKKDLLGFYYRNYMLFKLRIKPMIQLFEDDTQKYINPYLSCYKLLKAQYPSIRQNSRNGLYHNIRPHLKKYADEIKDVLGEFGYLTEPIYKLDQKDDFDIYMQDIADYLNIKHYPCILKVEDLK